MDKFKVDKSDEEIQKEYCVDINDYEFANLDDSLSLYIKEIARYPLLSKDEELKYTKLYKETKNKKYKDILVTRNLRLVINVAKTYMWTNVPLLDLIQEGNLGLMRSIETFDPDMGYKLSTYAYWWITQVIQRYLNNNSDFIRLPVHLKEKQFKINKFIAKYKSDNGGKQPSKDDIRKGTGFSEAEINTLLVHSIGVISIDTPVGEEDDSVIGDFIPSSDSVEDYAFNFDLRDKLYDAMSSLSEKEIKIIELRFGLLDGICHTLEEIGQIYGVSRERIRQIENKSIRKLKFSAKRRHLQDYIV